ncbi:ABC transporter transmembrane domain-containing protein [Actinomadura rupiterrae]|uniref:ABC transporter transmembrane domain-containing protein n=1 Tax=Actinomadura rupiterrae TaxID=559627 RepID=UPI0020A5BE0E|nr:ABC transporter ATP-binding protein [Actinomadura rupiterrae]MCP2336635.1 ABC-type multidrug transport system fused ATPase/permease subunit [Actinomadura rupiterrae]
MKELPVSDPGTPDHTSPTRYLLWLVRVQRRSVIGVAVLGSLFFLSPALMPAVIGRAIDDGVAGEDTGALLRWAGVLSALGVLQMVSSVTRHRLAVFNWLSAAYRTIQIVTRQTTRLGATLPKRLTAGEVVSVGISDVARLGDVLDIVGRGTGSVVAIAVVAVLLLVTSWPLGLVVLVGVPLILALAAPLLRPYERREDAHRELVSELNSTATDLVAGLRVLRGVGGEGLFAERYRRRSQDVRRAGVRVAWAESRISGAEVLLPGLLVALVTWVGAHFAQDHRITIGQLVAFYGYAVFLVEPLRTIGEMAQKVTKGRVAAGRVCRLLAVEPEITLSGTRAVEGPAELVDAASGLVVRPGRVTAVAAADPRDAAAVADRLGRYAEGDVTYNGVPLAEVADVRSKVLVAVNEDRLFSGPLRNTLSPPSGASGASGLDVAIEAAAADDIVEVDGLDGHVAEAGREFSGGQRQRLRLVRALAADPDVLVLVEPTSAVDAHTESAIAERIGRARSGRTTVIATTSPLVLDRADHVAFVEHGEVVAEGTHRDLLDTEPRYAAVVTRGAS